MSLTPRIGLVIVLALAATQVLDELLVRLVPPPNIIFYTHDWLAEQVAGAVRIADETAAGDRPSVLAHLNSEWLVFSTSGSPPEPPRDSQPVGGVRQILEAKLGDKVRRVTVTGMPLTDPDRATGTIPIVLSTMPALLQDIGDDSFQDDVTALGQLQIALQLADGAWLHVTEPNSESAITRRIRNIAALFGGLALIAGCAMLAARMVIRPLRHLSKAADRLGRDREVSELPKACVPEIDAIADSFRQMQQRLKRFVDERTYMLAAISHDLRTPLTRLRLFAECVCDEPERRLVLNDLEEMEQMIRASLTFASEESRLEPYGGVDLAALLISLCDTVSDAGGKALYQGPDHADLPCQPEAMRRAFANLIDNACKHGNEAQVRLTESVEAIEVTIAERNSDIRADQLALAFLPFRRLKNERKRESGEVGSTLTIARDVFHSHGGSIALAAATTEGLRARVRLPKSAV